MRKDMYKLMKQSIRLILVLLYIQNSIEATPIKPTATYSVPQLSSNAYLLMDYNSGQVLAERNSDKKIAPASLTKMMTMYVIDNEVKCNSVKWDDAINVSNNAWKAEGSRMFVEPGKPVTLKEIVRGIIIASGNDASIAAAEHVAGSEQAFANLMNYYAESLGMKQTNFVNATGLPDPNHQTTAHDLGILARAVIRDFPHTYKIYSEKSFFYNNIKQENRNRLLWINDTVDGIKTGHTDSAGFCLVASAKKNNMRLIAVILGAKSEEMRTIEANKLLSWGLRFFETHKLYQAGDKLQTIRVWMSKEKNIEVGLKDDVYITIAQGQYQNLKAVLNLPQVIKAPTKKGTVLGTYSIKLKDQLIIEQPVVALNNAPEGNIFHKMYDTVVLAFNSMTNTKV